MIATRLYITALVVVLVVFIISALSTPTTLAVPGPSKQATEQLKQSASHVIVGKVETVYEAPVTVDTAEQMRRHAYVVECSVVRVDRGRKLDQDRIYFKAIFFEEIPRDPPVPGYFRGTEWPRVKKGAEMRLHLNQRGDGMFDFVWWR